MPKKRKGLVQLLLFRVQVLADLHLLGDIKRKNIPDQRTIVSSLPNSLKKDPDKTTLRMIDTELVRHFRRVFRKFPRHRRQNNIVLGNDIFVGEGTVRAQFLHRDAEQLGEETVDVFNLPCAIFKNDHLHKRYGHIFGDFAQKRQRPVGLCLCLLKAFRGRDMIGHIKHAGMPDDLPVPCKFWRCLNLKPLGPIGRMVDLAGLAQLRQVFGTPKQRRPKSFDILGAHVAPR